MKDFLQKALLLFVATIIAFTLGEIAAQIFYYKKNHQWLWSALSGFHVGYTAPVNDRREYALRPGYADPSVTINEFGFRGDLIDPVAAKGNPLVCIIGDSVPFGYNVRDSETYPYYLERVLLGHGKYARVLNAGIPSYNIRQSFDRYWKDIVPRYKCTVVVLHAANDLSLLTQYRDQWTPDVTWASIRLKDSWGPSLFKYSAIFYYITQVLEQRREKQTESHIAYPTAKLLSSLQEIVNAQVERLHAENIPLVIMPIDPFYYQNDSQMRNTQLALWPRWNAFYNVWHQIIGDINGALKNISKEKAGVYYYDVCSDVDTQDRNHGFIDFIHYSPSGAQFVAERLYEFLSARGLV